MFIDGRDVAPDTTIEADICIIGTGPAGATLAGELADTTLGIVLLESGDQTFESGPQALAEGVAGDSGFSPFHVRSRQFGGTANRWTHKVGAAETLCRFTPFDPIDFEPRDWVADSGWPIDREALVPYYRRACVRCGIGPFDFDGATWERPEAPRLSFPGGRLTTTVFQFGPQESLLEPLKELVSRSERVTCCLNSTALALDTDDEARAVEGVEVGTPRGNRFRVKAATYVLATGGIDNARLLLLSDRAVPQGLGNRHDLVGRYFMDHYMVHSGYLFPSDPGVFDRTALYDLRFVDGTAIQGKLTFSDETVRKERLLGAATYLLPRYRTEYLRTRGVDALRALKGSIGAGRMPEDLPRRVRDVAGLPLHAGYAIYRKLIRRRLQYPWIAIGGWSDLPDKPFEFGNFEIVHLIEQVPHRDNRLTLSEERDRFGCPKPKVDCVLREPDIRGIRRMQELLAEEFRRTGLGRLDLTPAASPRVLSPDGSGHHMGTTRMHADPRQGVVDADGLVHGVSNLYIAGSSVFPTGSYANPTLTIVAMAIRLAEHLKAARRPSAVGSGGPDRDGDRTAPAAGESPTPWMNILMPADINDKIVVLTGAGTGIGAALAQGFCRDGARVVGFGRTEATLAKTASLCGQGRMSYVVGDISSEPDVRRLVEEATGRHGRIDVLINNAAVYPRGTLLEGSFDEWRDAIRINVIGTALCCRLVLPGMLERKSGRIINVGSFAGNDPMPGASAYSVSKAALMSLTRAIANEIDRGLYPDVLVNELIPGAIATQMTPHGGDDPATVYPRARFLVDLPAGGPTGKVFMNDRVHQTDYGLKAKLKRRVARLRSRLTGAPNYD